MDDINLKTWVRNFVLILVPTLGVGVTFAVLLDLMVGWFVGLAVGIAFLGATVTSRAGKN